MFYWKKKKRKKNLDFTLKLSLAIDLNENEKLLNWPNTIELFPKKSIPLWRTIKYIVILISHSLREEFSMASIIDIAADFLSLYLGQVQSVTDRRAIRHWKTLFVHLPHGLLHWVKSSPGPALMGSEITWSSHWGAVCHCTRLTSVVFADLFQEQCLNFVFVLFSHRLSIRK